MGCAQKAAGEAGRCADELSSALDEIAKGASPLVQRITDYLSAGGLFNPEMAEHAHVRDLLIDCRESLAAQPKPSLTTTQFMDAIRDYGDGLGNFVLGTAYRISEATARLNAALGAPVTIHAPITTL